MPPIPNIFGRNRRLWQREGGRKRVNEEGGREIPNNPIGSTCVHNDLTTFPKRLMDIRLHLAL